MKRIRLDKIGAAAKNAPISKDAYISPDTVAEAGYVVAVRVLTDKAVYNQLENIEGRMTRLKPNDVVAGVLGRRRALRGYVGDVPQSLRPGDILQILNLGGVIGRCTSYAPDVGKPFDVELLGAVLHFPFFGQRVGKAVNIAEHGLKDDSLVEHSAPIVCVVGTCMDSGKTVAACEIVHGLTQRGKAVAAGKLTGVALQRDVLAMLDHGAIEALSFIDAGLATTDPDTAPNAARKILNQLNQARPDVVVLELGDGLLGEYGVQAILEADDLRRRVRSIVLCANDTVGAWGGIHLLRDSYGLVPDVISGPATDNDVGGSFIETTLDVPSANAFSAPTRLLELVQKKLFGENRDA